jgi:hypothetical protein
LENGSLRILAILQANLSAFTVCYFAETGETKMYRKSGFRNLRRFTVVVWMSVLGLFVFPAQVSMAQGGDSLFLPYVNTEKAPNTNASALVVSHSIPKAQQTKALKFWTHEALAAAEPLEIAVQVGPATAAEAAQSEPVVAAVGLPGFAPGGAAAPGAERAAQAAYAEDWAPMAEAAAIQSPQAVDGTSEIFTSYQANYSNKLWHLYPHTWVGRLSFQTANGTSTCSGTSISNNIMLTAAHCLYDTKNDQWYSNWVFTPAYRAGNAPYGSFPATNCTVLTSWLNLTGNYTIGGWAKHDVGVCNMGTNSAGTTLNNAVGWMGRQWDGPDVLHFHSLGYPFRNHNNTYLPYPGAYLTACVAESALQATDTRRMGCNRTQGMDGGPWVVGYAPGELLGWVDGVTSGFVIGTKNIYGARFTSNNIVVLCEGAGC